MRAEEFLDVLDCDFYTGVPDSQLKALCDCLMDRYGADSTQHIIAANEGNAAALAAGYHLSSGKSAVVYMQNSGEGNVINPMASLLHEKVYAIPVIFVIGWRGEPGVHDEPQHIYQGEVTLKLLEDMGVAYTVLSKETRAEELRGIMEDFRKKLSAGHCVAIVVRKGALAYDGRVTYENPWTLGREEAIEIIATASGADPVVSTTGKASRELFEIRERMGQGHEKDFLTVGSMGHCSSIALAIALQQRQRRVWCIDGDGAVLMHMGALALMAQKAPKNLVHIVINNGAHETVGGQPTALRELKISEIATACGYPKTMRASDAGALRSALDQAKAADCLTLIEICCSLGARADLGRPTTTAIENKENFMSFLRSSPR